MNVLRHVKTVVNSFQLTLPKIGIGWMFALLTSNFNRITIYEFGVVAVLVTSMIGLYHFLSPFQVIFGRMTDRYPILGFRRGPYLLMGLLISASVFPFLPDVAASMGAGNVSAFAMGFVLLSIFGMGFAMAGNAHLALIADNTGERSRGIVVALVWTVQIVSIIVSASFMKRIMPVYEPAAMQRLYNLTMPIVLISTVVALIGNERRLSRTELEAAKAEARASTPSGNVFTAPINLLRNHSATRNFFGFIIFSTLGVFLQDSILEVYGAEVFNMTVSETTSFQQVWGGGVLLSMLVVGAAIAFRPVSKQLVTLVGSVGTAIGLLMLGGTSLFEMQEMLNPTLFVLGLGTGIYTVGALSTMMELSAIGATATYMGLWGMAQAFGNGFSSILAGGLHTSLIETGFLTAQNGYASIFTLEAALMLIGAALLTRVNVAGFLTDVTREDLTGAMELGGA